VSFRAETHDRGGNAIYTLHDDATGASASILPSYGFNLFDLRLPSAGLVRPVLVAADDFAEKPSHPARSGTPVLFPFPNRIRDGAFTFQGRQFHLPPTNGPNAIHGFAMEAAWDVIEHKATADEAVLVGRYQISKNSPDKSPLWPADAVLQIRFGLAGRRLAMNVAISNPAADDLPYGFGIHPYFRLPFWPGGNPAKTRVILPASKFWVLKDFLPTGELKPVDPRLDFRGGQPLHGLKLDDILTGLEFVAKGGTARLADLEKEAEFHLKFDSGFRELVVYTPSNRSDVIAVEPYTQTTDAINLQSRGVDAGLRVLKHGQQDAFLITMETLG
jgi:aldose 1-epimerase